MGRIDVLTILHKDLAIRGAANFTKRQGILSSSVALSVEIFFSNLRTLGKVIGSNWKEESTWPIKSEFFSVFLVGLDDDNIYPWAGWVFL